MVMEYYVPFELPSTAVIARLLHSFRGWIPHHSNLHGFECFLAVDNEHTDIGGQD